MKTEINEKERKSSPEEREENKYLLSTAEAAKIAEVTRQTTVNWCREYGIGIMVGGRWRIDPRELRKIMDGTMHKELTEKANNGEKNPN